VRIVLAGGSGFLGRALVRRLRADGHGVLVLSRHPGLHADLDPLEWDWRRPGLWSGTLDGADAVVNLCGEPLIGPRWSENRKLALLESRVGSACALAAACAASEHPPRVFLSASATGYYGDAPEGDSEESRGRGRGFLAELCACWEEAASKAPGAAFLRCGLVLGRGGALARMLPFFRLGLGGIFGSGRQWLPWIHVEDFVSAVAFLIRSGARGPFNLASPDPVRMEEFSRTLARALGRPCVVRLPAPWLSLCLGEGACLLLEGARAVPARLLESGFRFRFPSLEGALRDLLGAP
jgi:uncharacterized protein (TIGR01777 family)